MTMINLMWFFAGMFIGSLCAIFLISLLNAND